MAKAQEFSDEKAYKIALAKIRQWCASDEHCLWDVKQKLARTGSTSSEIDRILYLLTEEGFINENRYSLAFASGKFKLLKWGKNKIAAEMRKKMISDRLINAALNNIALDEYRGSLITLLNKKKRELRGETTSEMKQKLVRFALQKGYEAEMVYAILRITDENFNEITL